jgi:hypothetical protein
VVSAIDLLVTKLPYTKEEKHEWYLRNKQRMNAKAKLWRETHREQYNRVKNEWNHRRGVRPIEQYLVEVKLLPEERRDKKRIRNNCKKSKCCPLAPRCAFCGSTENLERAHFSYAQAWMYITLCRKHHKMFDKPLPSGG